MVASDDDALTVDMGFNFSFYVNFVNSPTFNDTPDAVYYE